MTLYTLADINRYFSQRSIQRGQLYVRQNRVRRLHVDSLGVLTAEVQGTMKTPYDVSFRIKVRDGKVSFDGECSCPVMYGCKHAAAALIKGLSATPVSANPSIATGLNTPLNDWLTSLATPSQEAPVVAQGKQLIYMLLGLPCLYICPEKWGI
jgi:uncharacterized Zn finger protein